MPGELGGRPNPHRPVDNRLGRVNVDGEVIAVAGDHALTLSWAAGGNEPIELPYYFRWEFRTGLRGDFEHLVRLLEPRKLSQLGIRDIDCTTPGYGLPSIVADDEDPAHPPPMTVVGCSCYSPLDNRAENFGLTA